MFHLAQILAPTAGGARLLGGMAAGIPAGPGSAGDAGPGARLISDRQGIGVDRRGLLERRQARRRFEPELGARLLGAGQRDSGARLLGG